MNHFMLPGLVHPDDMLTSDLGRYGMFAMVLIGELVKLGAKRKDLAKLSGAGMFRSPRRRHHRIKYSICQEVLGIGRHPGRQ
jgi:chemotaxis receptor (MCP) glutamine deamidase CheD